MDRSLDESEVAASLDDVEFLVRSDHRVRVLAALADRPRDRRALRAATGASSPTMGRILADFEERRWIERDGGDCEVTPLGAFVVEHLAALCEALSTERKLRDVWQWLPREMDGFSVDLFADAVVSYPGPGYPSRPLERIATLIESADSVRGFGATMVKSNNLEAMCGAVLSGRDVEYVYEPAVYEAVVAWNPERVAEVAGRENCTTLLHDDLPDGDRCGLNLYEDRVAICCHDGRTGVLQAVVDTDAPAAVSWAESVYERIRDEAEPLDEATRVLPDPTD